MSEQTEDVERERIAAAVEVEGERWRGMTPGELAEEAVHAFQHCDEDPCICVHYIEAMFRALRTKLQDAHNGWAESDDALGRAEADLKRKDAALREEWSKNHTVECNTLEPCTSLGGLAECQYPFPALSQQPEEVGGG